MASSTRAIQYTIPAREDFNKLSDEQKTRVGEAVRLSPVSLFTFQIWLHTLQLACTH